MTYRNSDIENQLVFNPKTGELVVKSSISANIIADNYQFTQTEICEKGFYGGPSPDDIVALLLAAISIFESAKFFTRLIKAWFEKEKGKIIKIKKGNYELEVYGGMSEKEIENRIELFKKLVSDLKVDENDVEIISGNNSQSEFGIKNQTINGDRQQFADKITGVPARLIFPH